MRVRADILIAAMTDLRLPLLPMKLEGLPGCTEVAVAPLVGDVVQLGIEWTWHLAAGIFRRSMNW